MTPESQGGAFRGQAEIQQTTAQELTINTSNGSINDGVLYNLSTRSGFQVSNSFFESFDLYWAHVGSGNSIIGGKLQVMGTSRTAKGDGHKMSLVAGLGGNEHETDDESVEFTLSAREYMLIYGYRFGESVLPYVGLSHSTYDFDGTINASGSLKGLEPSFHTTILALNSGVELSLSALVAKLECSYQQIATDDTKDRTSFICGWSLGFAW